jgi:hypothetical protein
MASATGSSQETGPKNMLEALEPTDIVVVGRNAASVLTVDDSGKPVSANAKPMSANATTQASQTASDAKRTRKLFAHDDHNSNTVLPVWTESDTIEYQCDQKFEITKIKRAGWKIYGAPEDPFVHRKRPYVSEQEERDGRQMWIWTSGTLPAAANNQQYKMSFTINGEEIDPDVICGNPPPEP